MEVRVSNRGPNPVQVAEFQTAGIRFLNPSVYKDDTNYPPQLLAPEGLSVDDNSPILPGHTKVLTVTATDAAWENERLGNVVYDPDSRYGGLLTSIDSDGRRHVEPIGGPLLPCFNEPCAEIGRARREAADRAAAERAAAERAAVAVPAAPAAEAEWFWNAWAEAPRDKNPRTLRPSCPSLTSNRSGRIG